MFDGFNTKLGFFIYKACQMVSICTDRNEGQYTNNHNICIRCILSNQSYFIWDNSSHTIRLCHRSILPLWRRYKWNLQRLLLVSSCLLPGVIIADVILGWVSFFPFIPKSHTLKYSLPDSVFPPGVVVFVPLGFHLSLAPEHVCLIIKRGKQETPNFLSRYINGNIVQKGIR